ncbi:MAG: gliding motility lipoprotein GldB [Bacteroidetes bacterium]|nr:gliding motility lipoprotein GldB [Bacteroidota bacterium]
MSFRKTHFWLLASGCWLLSSCEQSRLEIDISKIKIEPVRIERFDQDFFSLNADNIVAKLPELQKKYHGFAELFVRNLLCHNGIQDSACIPEITHFVNDKDMRDAFNDCQKKFQDISLIESELTETFRHHQYYFPEKKLPKVLTMMSGFNYSIATADSVFAIGLEMYLGKESRFYEMIQIPNYKRITMQRAYMIPDFVRAWVMKEFPDNVKGGKTLLSEMIYRGKILYLADALMPQTEDTLKIGFTKKQMNWCNDHTGDIWGFWIKNKLLYSTAIDVISKFTGEGPFTTGFAKESPARTAVWTGWQIVRKYMNSHPEVSLEQLMNENDPQKILTLSKYKP